MERFGAWEGRRGYLSCFVALQLPPLCPRRWGEANGERAAAGVLVLWEEGSVPASHWHHICQSGGRWGCGNRAQEVERAGEDCCCSVLDLSPDRRLD